VKLRFSIRDLLWFAVVVALSVAWWLDRGSSQRVIEEMQNTAFSAAQAQRDDLARMAAELESVRARLTRAREEQWFREAPLLLSAEPSVLLFQACSYVAWEVKTVYDRRAWFRHHPVRLEIDISDVPYFKKFALGDPDVTISPLRLWLGDRPRKRVYVLPSVSVEEKRVVAGLYPEANILEIPRSYP
jgi:hypothetical protein